MLYSIFGLFQLRGHPFSKRVIFPTDRQSLPRPRCRFGSSFSLLPASDKALSSPHRSGTERELGTLDTHTQVSWTSGAYPLPAAASFRYRRCHRRSYARSILFAPSLGGDIEASVLLPIKFWHFSHWSPTQYCELEAARNFACRS